MKTVQYCLLVIAAATTVISGCNRSVDADTVMEVLSDRQWTNPQKPYGTEKVIVTLEGKLQEYSSRESQLPMRMFDFTITSQWVNWRGDLCFRSIAEIENQTKEYAIERINKAGTVWETNFHTGGYPKKIDPLGENYIVMYCTKEDE